MKLTRIPFASTLLICGALVGVILGLLAPKAAGAVTYSVYIQLWPSGGSTLSCGWHSGPCYDDDSRVSSGAALDWSPSSTVSFFSKSSTDSGVYAIAGTATIAVVSQSSCSHNVRADLKDNNSLQRASATYVHTANSVSNGTVIDINTQQYNLVSTTSAIGSTANETGCGDTWSGYHVHQEGSSGWTLANYPNHSTCNRPNITTDCWVSNSYYMGYANWSVNYP
jgi:hypothetical protein